MPNVNRLSRRSRGLAFCSYSIWQIAVNSPPFKGWKDLCRWTQGVLISRIMLSLDRPKEAMSQIFHAALWYALNQKGMWLAIATPQQQRAAYGKSWRYLTRAVMSSELNMHFHRLSTLMYTCVFLMNTHILYVAWSHSDSASWTRISWMTLWSWVQVWWCQNNNHTMSEHRLLYWRLILITVYHLYFPQCWQHV